jgi:hypothetical protein
MEKQSPARTVQLVCRDCLGLKDARTDIIKNCEGDTAQNGACPLYPYRMGKRISVKVFRKYCLYCNAGSSPLIESCPVETCPVFPYRFGKNPALTGINRSGIQKGSFGASKNPEKARQTTNKEK